MLIGIGKLCGLASLCPMTMKAVTLYIKPLLQKLRHHVKWDNFSRLQVDMGMIVSVEAGHDHVLDTRHNIHHNTVLS